MPTQRKARCFVAMAFDRDDTDALYEKAILPVLSANEVDPVIINRREDNRDINQQIIEQLNVCDFCIADLTYARQSVYYEAGYAQRTVGVIYTVRGDHLRKNQPDDLRVHFDLQMKPLIKWNSPDDATFRQKLERRLKSTVLRDWRIQRNRELKEKVERDAFAHLSLKDRLRALSKEAVASISILGFDLWSPISSGAWRQEPLSLRQLQRYDSIHWIMAVRRAKRVLHVVSLRIEESLTLHSIRDEIQRLFVLSAHPPHLDGSEMVEERMPVRETVEHHILCSTRPVPRARIMSAMPSLHWEEANECYVLQEDWTYKGARWTAKGKGREVDVEIVVSRKIQFHFIDAINSRPGFKAQLAQVISHMEGNTKSHPR